MFMNNSTFSNSVKIPQSDSSAEFSPQETADGSPMPIQTIPYLGDLTPDEVDIIRQVDVLAFDQAGCRMI